VIRSVPVPASQELPAAVQEHQPFGRPLGTALPLNCFPVKLSKAPGKLIFNHEQYSGSKTQQKQYFLLED
jgi:hypothetical protein